jgi:hypothetical protein
VEADLDKKQTDTVKANRIIAEEWQKVQANHPGVSLDFSGELDDIQESLDAMAVLFLVGLGLIYMILAAQFRSYWQPLLILVTVPLAFTGVALGLLVSRDPLSLYTMYGVIALTGIAVNSAIVLIDAANDRLKSGMGVLHAAVYAARRRVVPIIITSVTTIGGLFSLAFGLGGKSSCCGAGGERHRLGPGLRHRPDALRHPAALLADHAPARTAARRLAAALLRNQIMKLRIIAAAILAALAMAGCSQKEEPAQPLRTVRVMKIDGAAVSGGLTFPGEVRARFESPPRLPPRRQARRAARRCRRCGQKRPGAGATRCAGRLAQRGAGRGEPRAGRGGGEALPRAAREELRQPGRARRQGDGAEDGRGPGRRGDATRPATPPWWRTATAW